MAYFQFKTFFIIFAFFSLLQYNQSLIKFHLEDEELEVVKKILAGEDATNFRDIFETIFSRWMPQVLGHLEDILKV